MQIRSLVLLLTAGFALTGCGDTSEANRNVPAARPSSENVMTFGDYEVHVNALSTNQVPPQVAQAYGIVRSANRAMLNVAVLRNPGSIPVESDITVSAVNLTGQLKSISMRKVEEGAVDSDDVAIYYIGEVPVANRETLIFTVTVTLPNTDEPVSMKFQRQFYSD